MSDCQHSTWLEVTVGEKISLHDPDRLGRILTKLTNPITQQPSLIFFIGRKTKDIALHEVFPFNKIRKARNNVVADLHLDNSTYGSNHPILFADSDPKAIEASFREPKQTANCHEDATQVAQWALPPDHQLFSLLYARLFLPFADVICLFADDLGGVEGVSKLLKEWATIGISLTSEKQCRPRILVITTGSTVSPTYSTLELEDLRFTLLERSQSDLLACYSGISLLQLAGKHLSPRARYRRLKEVVFRLCDEVRQAKLSKRLLFSASHLRALFNQLTAHTATTLRRPFKPIVESRQGNAVDDTLTDHLNTFLRQCLYFKLPYDAIASFIASCILMDAYPPSMHSKLNFQVSLRAKSCLDFEPKEIYCELYKPHCLRALYLSHAAPTDRSDYHSMHIENHLDSLFHLMEETSESSAEIHRNNIKPQSLWWANLRSNHTCLFCLRRKPEHVLSCGHACCEICVRIFGMEMLGTEDHYQMGSCILCDSGTLKARLKPASAGFSIMSIDGGGIRGVIPLEFLSRLQNILGPECPIQDLIDVAFGTSAGNTLPSREYILLTDRK